MTFGKGPSTNRNPAPQQSAPVIQITASASSSENNAKQQSVGSSTAATSAPKPHSVPTDEQV